MPAKMVYNKLQVCIQSGATVYMIYLDNSATTAVSPAAAQTAMRVMTSVYGNPSSLHSLGFAAEQEMSQARTRVAGLIGAAPEQIVFTSSGTEANNMALFGAAKARARRGRHIVTTAVEHTSAARVIDALEADGFAVTRLVPGTDGTLSAAQVLSACRDDTVLVSMMCVNNETGARFPVEAVACAVHRRLPDEGHQHEGGQDRPDGERGRRTGRFSAGGQAPDAFAGGVGRGAGGAGGRDVVCEPGSAAGGA